MSGSSSIPNYLDTVFEYADLTAIVGEPTYDTLKLLLNQLKANARAVRTTLGGGNHGHLGLLLSPQQYEIIAPGTPFKDLKNAIVKTQLTYQLTPPNMHRINAAERAIRTFKNHFISGLATLDPEFPIRECQKSHLRVNGL